MERAHDAAFGADEGIIDEELSLRADGVPPRQFPSFDCPCNCLLAGARAALVVFDKLKGVELTTVHHEAQAYNAPCQFADIWAASPGNEVADRVAVHFVGLVHTVSFNRVAALVFDLDPDCAARARIGVEGQPFAAKTQRHGDQLAALIRSIGRNEAVQSQPRAEVSPSLERDSLADAIAEAAVVDPQTRRRPALAV